MKNMLQNHENCNIIHPPTQLNLFLTSLSALLVKIIMKTSKNRCKNKN